MITKTKDKVENKESSVSKLPKSLVVMIDKEENRLLYTRIRDVEDVRKSELAYIKAAEEYKAQRLLYEADIASLEEKKKETSQTINERAESLFRVLMKHSAVKSVRVLSEGTCLVVETKPLFTDIRVEEGSRKMSRACIGAFTIRFHLEKKFIRVENKVFGRGECEHWAVRRQEPCLGDYRDEIRAQFDRRDYYALFDTMYQFLICSTVDGSAYERSDHWRDDKRDLSTFVATRMRDQFSVGDYAIVTQREVDGKALQGMVGKVIKMDSPEWLTVEFKDSMQGHDGDGSGQPGHCWNMSVSVLMKINKDLYDEKAVYSIRQLDGTQDAIEAIDALPKGSTVEEIEAIAEASYKNAIKIEA